MGRQIHWTRPAAHPIATEGAAPPRLKGHYSPITNVTEELGGGSALAKTLRTLAAANRHSVRHRLASGRRDRLAALDLRRGRMIPVRAGAERSSRSAMGAQESAAARSSLPPAAPLEAYPKKVWQLSPRPCLTEEEKSPRLTAFASWLFLSRPTVEGASARLGRISRGSLPVARPKQISK
jgi:hypothetical protein